MRNKEKINEWQRNYYQKRKLEKDYIESKRVFARNYYQNNKEKIKLRGKVYREKNRVKMREYRRNYRWQNPRGIYSVVMGGAKKRGLEVTINASEFIDWYSKQDKGCFYCKRSIEKIDERNDFFAKRSKRLTVDRIDNSKGYSGDNILLCCYRCNSIKGDFFTKDEMIRIGNIIKKKCLK